MSFPSVAKQPELSIIAPSSVLEVEPKERKKERKMMELIFLPVVRLSESAVVWLLPVKAKMKLIHTVKNKKYFFPQIH